LEGIDVGVVIELRDVTYSYPLANTPAIKNVSLKVEEGKFYGVIGKNGSGKTTLCNIIRGFAPSFFKGELKGEVILYDKPLSEYDQGELALHMGYVFQNPFNQISGVKDTVFEEVAFGLENFGVPVEEIEDRVMEIMKLTKIDHLAEQNPFELSGGQQQRLALASILVLEPDIMVIDEPTSQLDPEGTESVFEIISELKKAKKTIILVEHKVDLIAEYADEVFVLNDGELIKSGNKHEVLTDISLLDQGVQLPQMAVLGDRLRKKGLNPDYIPITEEEAKDVIGRLINREAK